MSIVLSVLISSLILIGGCKYLLKVIMMSDQ